MNNHNIWLCKQTDTQTSKSCSQSEIKDCENIISPKNSGNKKNLQLEGEIVCLHHPLDFPRARVVFACWWDPSWLDERGWSCTIVEPIVRTESAAPVRYFPFRLPIDFLCLEDCSNRWYYHHWFGHGLFISPQVDHSDTSFALGAQPEQFRI